MAIVKRYLKKNRCYLAGRRLEVKGIMLHSVGCAQPKAVVFIRNWDDKKCGVCVHGFIDGNDGTVYQTLPWVMRGWHCGSGRNGSGNGTHIGIEMCEPAGVRYTDGRAFVCTDLAGARECVKRTYGAAVEVFAGLCMEYELDPLEDGVVISHAEGHERGIASNHGDPEHLWRGLGMGYTMDGFRRDVKRKMDELVGEDTSEEDVQSAVEPFVVRVRRKDLNIRKGPGTDTEKTGRVTGGGCFTIVEVRSGKGSAAGWGRLKSGAGWISLGFCEKI